jgi:uncharacterized phage protein (TIGR02218 family)
MKTISTALQTHLEGECLTLAHCWKLTRKDGQVMGFTQHDRDLVIGGITYHAATGFTPTAIESQASLAVDNLDIEGMLSAGSITEQDVMAGRYDFAEIEVFAVNYADVTQGIMRLRKGWLGEIEIRNQQFIAEIRGLTQKLAQHCGELYAPICRAQLGDARCKVNLAAYRVTGTVTAVSTTQSHFTDTARSETIGHFNGGKVTFTTGQNSGISAEVKESRGNQMILALPLPFPLAVGDAYSLEQGCDKTISTCAARYNNAVNFRGEPHVPGLDKMLETAGTRSVW